jgi:hypothetical protein
MQDSGTVLYVDSNGFNDNEEGVYISYIKAVHDDLELISTSFNINTESINYAPKDSGSCTFDCRVEIDTLRIDLYDCFTD